MYFYRHYATSALRSTNKIIIGISEELSFLYHHAHTVNGKASPRNNIKGAYPHHQQNLLHAKHTK